MTSPLECKHGHLKRACELCESEYTASRYENMVNAMQREREAESAELAQLRAANAVLTERCEKLEAVRDVLQLWMNHDPAVDMSHVSDAMDACLPPPAKKGTCEVHDHLLPDGRCSCPPAATEAGETCTGSANNTDKPWRAEMICCGRRDGTEWFATYKEATAFRESYTSGPGVDPRGYSGNGHCGHQRSVVIYGPTHGPACQSPAPGAEAEEGRG